MSNDPDDDIEALSGWLTVYSAWLDGDTEPIAKWLLQPRANAPEDSRLFLAALIRGEAKRPRGRRARRSGQQDRAIAAEVFKARTQHSKRAKTTNPSERAIDEVAKRRGVSADVVRGVIEKLSKAGFTFEAWHRWGCPTFAENT